MKTNEGGAAFGAIGKERSKLLATVLAVLMVMSVAVFALSGEDTNADAWDGTSATEFTEAPTQISSAADLKGFADWVNAVDETSGITVELTTDIDLGGYAWEPIGMSYRNGTGVTEASHPFEGTFDGNGYAITGLNVVKESYQNEDGSEATLGLFGTLNGGTVENLIVGGTVSGYDATGLIVGFMFGNSTVDNCFTTDGSEVSGGDNTGGIVGKIYGGSITDSSNYADVESSGSQFNVNQAKAGGIAAHADARTADITISNVSNHGDITTDDNLSGGIIGMIQATGTISVNSGIDFSTETAIGSSPTSENVTVSDVGTVSERYPDNEISATAFIGTVDNVSMDKSLIFLNGTGAIIEEGVTAGWTRVITSDGDLICHADLSRYSVYGGSYKDDVDSVSITMNGGSMTSVAGGGYLDAKVITANIVINGGNLSYGVSGGGLCGSLSVDEIADMSGYNYTGTVTITINGGTMPVANAGGAQSYAYVEDATMTISGGTFDEIIAGGINGYTNTSKVILDAAEGSSINAGLVTAANRGEVNSADIDIIDLGDGQIKIVAVGSLSGTTSTDGGPNGVVDNVDLDIASDVNIGEGVFLGGAQWGVGKHNPWDTTTENALIKANLTINAPGRTIFGNDVIPNADYEVETAMAVDYTIGADRTWNITAGTVQMDVGHSLSLMTGATFDGMLSGPDGITADFNNLTAGTAGLTITIGSFIIDGETDDTQESSATFSDGAVVEGTNAGVDYIFDGSVTFNNFIQGDGTLTFKDADGNEYDNVVEAIDAGVDIRLGSNTSLSDLPFSTGDIILEFDYDGTAHSPATGIPFTANEGYTISSVYISGGNCVSGKIPNMAVMAQTNVGTYTIQYTLVITDAQGQSVTYTPTIEWSILPQNVEITHDDISKEYDGTDDVDQIFSGSADGLTLGDAYYTDINAGEGKEVRLPIVIAEGSVAENYTFTVNGAEAELMGDAEAGYYIVLQGTITQKEITVIVTAPEKEYDGSAYEYTYSSGTDVEGDQLSVAVTTAGVDAGTYTGSSNLKFGDPIIMNGVIDVTDNYIINIDESSTLTIDQRDITISPATGAVITKEYNGWSSRIMSESDFQMSGAIDGDDVSFDWTPGASNIWYNSPNVLEANTLTVKGLFLEGEDSSNYELPNTTVVFVDDENGLTVGITPMVLTIRNGSDVSIEKTYDNGNTVPSGQIDTNDYSVSAAQNGTYPNIEINAAVFGSVDAGTGLTVYVTVATLVDGDNGVASNFALPEMQTTDDGIKYYFSITGVNVKIDPITVDGKMVKGSLSEQDGQIILTVTVKSGGLELTDFGSTLKFEDESIDAIEGTNSYNIDEPGSYTATVTSNDDNWVASNVEAPIDVDFDYTANFFTQTTLNGEYILELTVSFENGMVHTPAATYVPEGYELVGWRTADGTEYGVGEYAPVSAIGTDFYAVYEEIGGSTPEPTGPTVTIDIPDEFPIGTEIEFTVSTTAGNYTGGNVQGTGIFEGIPGVDYNIWYWEIQDNSWHEWTSGNFGPEEGFPLTDTTSKFKIQFINAGTYDLTVQIVTVSDNGVVCETSAVVDVPAENSLGYHVLDALDYVYVDDGEYNADAYSYVAEFDADADSIIATYGHEYFEALIAYITNTETDEQADMAEDVMNDFARYMGALYRSSDGDVGRVYFNGTEYVWKAATDGKWLHGCNWRDESGVTLTSSVVDYIESTQSTGIIMEIAVPGGDRQVLTYSAVFEDAPTPDIQYYNVTLEASEGVQFYVLDGSMVVAGIYSVAEGAHTISAVAADGWQFTGGTPAFTGAENGQFEVVDQDLTISVSNVEQIVEESLKYIVNFSYQLVDGTTIETDQPKSMTVYFLRDQVPTVVLPVPTIDGYTFVGWYESDGEYFSGGGQVVLTSMETSLTARFIQMATYTVVFSGEGGQTYSNVAIGDAVVAPEVEVAEGYMAYWTTENGFIVDLGERYYLSSMDVGENNTVTFTLVTEEIPEDPTYIITIPTGTGYTSMSGIISGIVSGQDRTFTINPTAGYAISAVNATYDEGGDVTINSYQNGESWIVTIYGITGDVTVTVAVEQKDVVDGVFVEADYAPYGASVTLSPVSSGDDGILPNGTITVFYTYRTTVTIDGVQYEGNTTGSFTAAVYTNDDGSSIDHVSVTGDYPESTIRGYAVFTDAEGNSYYSTFFTVNVLSEAGE